MFKHGSFCIYQKNIGIPQYIRRVLRVKRVRRDGRLGQKLLGILLHVRAVQVQSVLEECRTNALKVRAAGPEPTRHLAGGCRAYEITKRKRLLQNCTNLFQLAALRPRIGRKWRRLIDV